MMKTIRLLLMLVLLWTELQLSAQILVSTNKTITQDELLATVQSNIFNSKTVVASGQAIFSSKSGYVRILLSNNNGYYRLP